VITPQLLREWNACWDDRHITSHFAGRTGLTPREVAEDESVSLDDRMWVLCRALWYRSESADRTFAIDSAELVSYLAGRPEDCAEHARLVEDLRRIYALPAEERSVELAIWSAAWDAARAAAWNAAWAAARDAAWDAAWAAAWDVAGAAAGAVARAVARAVAMDAAMDAARDAAKNAAMDAARAAAWAVAMAVAMDAAMDAALHKAIYRAIVALGPDAEGWEDGVDRWEMTAAVMLAELGGTDICDLHPHLIGYEILLLTEEP